MRNLDFMLPLVVMLALMTGCPAAQAGDIVLSPRQVVNLAAQNSQTAAVAASDTLAAAADVRHARATWYPTVNLQGQYITRDHQPEIAAGPLSFPMGNQSNGEYQLTARELLWNGGQRDLAITAARQNLDATRMAGLSRIQSTQLAALNRYLTAMDLKDRNRVLAQSLQSLQAHLKDVQDLYDQGLVARNDLLETRVRLDQVRDVRAAVDDNLSLTFQDLNRILGRDPNTPITLPDSLQTVPINGPTAVDDPDSLLQQNYGFRAALQVENTSRTLSDLARKAKYPNLFLSASHVWQDNDALVYPHVNSVALGVSWNVFDGGARSAETAKADARVLAASRNRLEAQRRASIELDQARRTLRQAQREELTARSNVTAAEENLRIVTDQYQEGLARSSDVLDAEALLADSRLQIIIKHHQGFLAAARLAAVTGQDLVSFYSTPETGKQGSIAP